MILSCKNQQEEITPKQEVKSRIKNEDLKSMIPHLLEIHKLTFNNVPDYESRHPDPTFIRFLTTENYIYAHISALDCNDKSLYYFMDEIKSHPVSIFVESKGFEPERYFELEGLSKSKENRYTICDDWYYTVGKFEIQNGKLILEKISTTFDNSCVDCFYDKSDSAFLNEIGILISEPEPFNSSK